MTEPRIRRRQAPRRRALRRAAAGVGALALLAAALAVGVAVGESLHDNPQPGGTQNLIRTLVPQPLAPAAETTVTVTVTTT